MPLAFSNIRIIFSFFWDCCKGKFAFFGDGLSFLNCKIVSIIESTSPSLYFRLCPSAKIVSKASELLPEPESPEITMSLSRGIFMINLSMSACIAGIADNLL